MDEDLRVGFNYLYTNQPRLALAQFESSLRKKPDNETAATGLVMALLENDKLDEARQAIEKFRIINNKPDSLTTLFWLISYETNDTEALQKINTKVLHPSQFALMSNIKNLPAKIMARVLLLGTLIYVNPDIKIWMKAAIAKESPEALFMLAGLEMIAGNFEKGFNYLDRSKKAGLAPAFFFDTYFKISHVQHSDAEEEKNRAIKLASETMDVLNYPNQFFNKNLLQAFIYYLSGNNSAYLKIVEQLQAQDQSLGIIYAQLLLQKPGNNESDEKAFAILENILQKNDDGPPILIVLLMKILAHQSVSLNPVLSRLQEPSVSNFFKARLLPSFGVNLIDFFQPAILEKVRKKYPSNDLSPLISRFKVNVDGAPQLLLWKPIFQQITQIMEKPPQPVVLKEKKETVVKKSASKKQSATAKKNPTASQTPSSVEKSNFFERVKRKVKEAKQTKTNMPQ